MKTFEEIKNEYETAGFNTFRDITKLNYFDTYECSYQKKIEDEFGTMYFVNVTIWHMSFPVISDSRGKIVQELDIQFCTEDDLEGDAINITRNVRSPEEAEAITYEMWKALNCGYYETRGW